MHQGQVVSNETLLSLTNTDSNESLAWIIFINENLAGLIDHFNSKLCDPFDMVPFLILNKIGDTHVCYSKKKCHVRAPL